MEDGMVSIIVPVYNGAKYLESCVESLRAQTYEKLEILLVDDGSTDGSSELCDRLSGEDARIRAIHTENGGVSAARNRGMEEAKGEYLSFVDADDLAAPDMIEYLVGLMERTGSDVAGCGFLEFDDEKALQDGRAEIRCNHKETVQVLQQKEFIEKGILSSDTSCCNKLFRHDRMLRRHFKGGLSIGEDMLLLLGLATEGARYARGSLKGYYYRRNESSAMKRRFNKSYMDQITCWQQAKRQIARTAPELQDRAISVLMVSVMLVAGKLSELSGKERKDWSKEIKYCREQINECMKNRKAFCMLTTGYRLKTMLFRSFPACYLNLYGLHRRLKRIGMESAQ